jgi:hypothetical protein
MENAEKGGIAMMNGCLRVVSERFPLLRERAARRFGCDQIFRELCEDYEACAETLARFEAGGRGADGLRDEYAALLLRLEHEVLRYLSDHPEREES